MSDDLMRTIGEILLPKCPQCGSRECGPYRCRMSGQTHSIFKENQYADTMIRKDKEKRYGQR